MADAGTTFRTTAIAAACVAAGFLLGRWTARLGAEVPRSGTIPPPAPARPRAPEPAEGPSATAPAVPQGGPAPPGDRAGRDPDPGPPPEAVRTLLAWLRSVDPSRFESLAPEELLQKETLALAGRDLREPGEIARLALLPRLRILELSDARVSAATAEVLADLPLRGLVLHSAKIPGAAVRALGRMGTLKVLVLARTGLADEVLLALSSGDGLASLEELVLWNNFELTDAGLARLEGLPRLRKLGLSGCVRITDAGLASVAKVAGLEELDVESCRGITDAGLGHLRGLRNLRRLDLSVLPVTDEGLRHLSECPSLRELRLRGDPIRGPGLRWIAGLPHLETLDLKQTPLESTAELRAFPALRFLDIFGTRVPAEEARRFAEEFPGIAVDR